MDPNIQGQPLILEISLGHVLILGGIIGLSIIFGFTVLGMFLWLAISRMNKVLEVLAGEIRKARSEQMSVAQGIQDSNARVGETLSEFKGYMHGRDSN